jgi:hypothetical protein
MTKRIDSSYSIVTVKSITDRYTLIYYIKRVQDR